MNKNEFTYLLQNPHLVTKNQTQQLTEIVKEFPYFQAAHALQLKSFKSEKSYKYNSALKTTAAYTVDRIVLFNTITSSLFSSETTEAETTVKQLHTKIAKKEADKTSEKIEETKNEILETKSSETLLEIGKPISFSSSEPHTFNEWMQLISHKPIDRTDINKSDNKSEEISKYSLIDTFIKKNPKIKPVDKTTTNTDISTHSTAEDTNLMTETLAKVYLEQKKYDNAIKAYRILSLKYPEKSGFFADRIKAIKILQRNKS